MAVGNRASGDRYLLLVNREWIPAFRACSPTTPLPPECAFGSMWSDNPVHSEFTARPPRLPAEANHYHVHKPVAAASIPGTAFIASHNVKPRPGRACDLCRRRKTKCDGPSAPDNICSNCVQNTQSCTYLCAYMRILLSFRVSHLPLAKPLAQEVHQKRTSHSFLFARFCLTSHPCSTAMSLASKTVWRRWKHYSRECVSHKSVNATSF